MVKKCPSDLPVHVISDMNMLIINYNKVKKIFRFKISLYRALFPQGDQYGLTTATTIQS